MASESKSYRQTSFGCSKPVYPFLSGKLNLTEASKAGKICFKSSSSSSSSSAMIRKLSDCVNRFDTIRSIIVKISEHRRARSTTMERGSAHTTTKATRRSTARIERGKKITFKNHSEDKCFWNPKFPNFCPRKEGGKPSMYNSSPMAVMQYSVECHGRNDSGHAEVAAREIRCDTLLQYI